MTFNRLVYVAFYRYVINPYSLCWWSYSLKKKRMSKVSSSCFQRFQFIDHIMLANSLEIIFILSLICIRLTTKIIVGIGSAPVVAIHKCL